MAAGCEKEKTREDGSAWDPFADAWNPFAAPANVFALIFFGLFLISIADSIF